MEETFYSALGVASDADDETIRRAYRDLVKEHHPDVSDDPDAPERFKRLTTARDVLVDEDERARYDRLGHEAYVSQYVDSSVWKAPSSSGEGRSRQNRSATTSSGTRSRASGESDVGGRSAWLGEDAPEGGREKPPGWERRRAARHTGTNGADDEQWQQASRTYRRADTNVTSKKSRLAAVVSGARKVGPWIVIHIVFLLSAIATGWFTFTQANENFTPSAPAVTFGILVIALVAFLSVMHVVSRLYT